MSEVEAHLAAAAANHRPFVMHLAGTGTFRPTSPVVFIHVATGVSDCELLEQAIRQGPLARELAFPYHPHVTVAQDVPEPALDEAYEGLSGFVARFPVDRFALFSRDPDGRWAWRTEFQLGAPSAG
jgi:2'-5' RNA ligase